MTSKGPNWSRHEGDAGLAQPRDDLAAVHEQLAGPPRLVQYAGAATAVRVLGDVQAVEHQLAVVLLNERSRQRRVAGPKGLHLVTDQDYPGLVCLENRVVMLARLFEAMDLRPVALDAVTVPSSSIPAAHSTAPAPAGPTDMGTVPGERPGEVPRHGNDLGAAAPAGHCPVVVILQISKPGTFKLALENAGRQGLATCASSARAAIPVERHGLKLRASPRVCLAAT
jgi:hypothetical protein